MTVKKNKKAKKSPLTSQKKVKTREGPKKAEKLNASILPLRSTPKTGKDKKDNSGRFSEEVQEFIRRRKLDLAESEDKNFTEESRKRGLRESVKKETEKELQPRLTPDRSKPNMQPSDIKESANEAKKSEKDVEKELLERTEGLQFKDVLEVDVNDEGTLICLAAFWLGQEDSLKMVGFEAQELTRLGKMLGAELRYDFLKNYLIEATPEK